jgi:hypothetical protein
MVWSRTPDGDENISDVRAFRVEEDDRGVDLRASDSIFLMEKNHGVEAEILVALARCGDVHGNSMGEKGAWQCSVVALRSLFRFVRRNKRKEDFQI